MSLTQDWRFRNECSPFQDEENYYITVESQYETPNDEKEQRLTEAQRDGVFKLLKFYGKDTTGVFEEQGGVFDASNVEDYYVAYRPCVRMKVLVSIPKAVFDAVDDDPTACDINKPVEGFLSAFIPIGQATTSIELVAQGLESLLPELIKSDKFISNVNITREIKRLRAAGRAIDRYINLNNIPPSDIQDPECVQPNEVDRELEIGFSFDYKAVFALVEREQYTIGYDCFLATPELSHITTVNYLINLKPMLQELTEKQSASFNAFDFLARYTLPTPVLETKQKPLDGLDKYDQNGNLFSFANLAKLVTLDLDVDLCKTDEEKLAEDTTLLNSETRRQIADAAEQTEEFVGNNVISAEGVQRLRTRIQKASENAEQGEAIRVLYDDVMARINLGCVLEETIQCVLENMISSFGESVFNDPDLEEVIRIGNVAFNETSISPNNCTLERCDGTPDIDFKIGFPVFQGLEIPSNFPTLDFLAGTIDTALLNLYNTLVSSLSSLILGIIESLCDLLTSLPDGVVEQINQGFKTWLSDTLGIDVADLSNPDVWANTLVSAGGKGFVGVIGNAVSKFEGSLEAAWSETGVAVNIPNPLTGEVEERFISPEFLVNALSEVSRGVDELEAVCTPTEIQTIYKGTARPSVVELAFKCVTRNGSTLFDSQETFVDVMSGIGDILNPQFLTQEIEEQSVTSNICDVGDGTQQALLREAILRQKDTNLSSQEIDEIINKEKQRSKEKVLQAADTLRSYQAGGLAPAFPNIFGEGGLIPETPPVIDDIVRLVAELSMQSVVNNFSIDSSNYSGSWEALSDDNPFRIYNNSVTSEQSDVYKIGYSLTTQPQNVIQEEEYNIILTDQGSTLVIYDFGVRFRNNDSENLEEELQKAYSNTFGTTGPYIPLYWQIEEFVKDKDTGSGTYEKRFEDPEDSTIYYVVTVAEDEGQVFVQQRQGPGVQTTDVVRETGFENEIIKLSLAAQTTKTVTQKSDDFTIGNTAATLGAKSSTGRLRTDIFTTGFGDLQIEQNVEILSPEAQAFGEDLDLAVLNETLIKQFIAYIPEQEGTETELDLTYPATDILAYSQLSQFSSGFSSRILSATLSGEVCDTLSASRRTNATAALRMLVRNFIVEQALISIQVFNSFDISFMESDLFISSVYETLATEISEYQSSFDTLESSLLSELKEVALKYYELLKVLGEDDREPQSGKLAIKEVIADEVKILKQPIINALGLQFNTNTWDDFLIDNVFGEIDNVDEILQKDTIAFVSKENPQSFVFLRDKSEDNGVTTYAYDLLKIIDATTTETAGGDTTPRVSFEVAGFKAETIISIQCEQENASEADENEIYSNLRAMMIETENYQKLFYELVPVDSLVATLSLYQYSALSDPAVYPNNDDLYDLMGKTKLSTLQIFAAAIYGGGKISYQDPFLEKAGTDQVF